MTEDQPEGQPVSPGIDGHAPVPTLREALRLLGRESGTEVLRALELRLRDLLAEVTRSECVPDAEESAWLTAAALGRVAGPAALPMVRTTLAIDRRLQHAGEPTTKALLLGVAGEWVRSREACSGALQEVGRTMASEERERLVELLARLPLLGIFDSKSIRFLGSETLCRWWDLQLLERVMDVAWAYGPSGNLMDPFSASLDAIISSLSRADLERAAELAEGVTSENKDFKFLGGDIDAKRSSWMKSPMFWEGLREIAAELRRRIV